MIAVTFLFLWAITWTGSFAAPQSRDEAKPQDIEFLMPKVQPTVKDTYLCIPLKMKKTPTYIVGFRPHANKDIAHHMLLYGCSTPGSREPVWNCGEMAHSSSNYAMASVCSGGPKILYAWAMDAPSLTLPEDVAFKVGGDTDIKYLVLQVHYKDVSTFLPPNNGKDSSGITMVTSQTRLTKRAGVYLMGTGGVVPKKATVYMETACPFDENMVIHPFAFRTHAHGHGMVTSGFRIRDGEWTEIGRKSPQKPQMFYNVTHPGIDVKDGDILAARCTMVNDENRDVKIGNTQTDEMCNFYIMYYVDGDKTMHNSYCFSPGPPSWSWATLDKTIDMHLEDIPKTASVVPYTGEELKQSVKKASAGFDVDTIAGLKDNFDDDQFDFPSSHDTMDAGYDKVQMDKLSRILDNMYDMYQEEDEENYPDYNIY